MTYIALLRGINVGGKAIISMAELKACFETAGYTDVKTYINSGNVVFRSTKQSVETLTKTLEAAVKKQFDIPVRVLIKSPVQLKTINDTIPADWVNDAVTKCDVLLLWPDIDTPDILERIPHRPEIETLRYAPGAVVHMVPKKDATKSRVNRIVGTEIYQSMTLRNVNTIRKLIALAEKEA
jgi:uncharacterized protein (DUF1697 family)